MHAIEKTLQPNDVGETGHQGGPYVSKDSRILSFFPELDTSRPKPYRELVFRDMDGEEHRLRFRWWGSKQEYHLTGLAGFYEKYGVQSGDGLQLVKDGDELAIRHIPADELDDDDVVIELNSWRVRELPEENPETTYIGKLPAGARRRVEVNRYERSRVARERCLQHHGTACSVCGMSFSQRYGEIGDGFIHVHHVIPVASLDEGYRLHPEEDLVPVCPNCHAMLHGRDPPYSIQELQGILEAGRCS